MQIQPSSWKTDRMSESAAKEEYLLLSGLCSCVFQMSRRPRRLCEYIIIIISSLCSSHKKKPPASVPRSLNIRKHLMTPHQEQSVRFHLLVRPAGGRSLTEWFKRPISQHLREERSAATRSPQWKTWSLKPPPFWWRDKYCIFSFTCIQIYQNRYCIRNITSSA